MVAGAGAIDERCDFWGHVRVRLHGCTGEGRFEVLEGSLAFLDPLEFSAFFRLPDEVT